MELQITGQNIEVGPKVRQHVEKRLGTLDRHLPLIKAGKVEIVAEGTKSKEQRHVVQVTLEVDGTVIRGEERGPDLFTAIDKVAELMDRRIDRYKGKLYGRKKGAESARVPAQETAEPTAQIVKTKRFTARRMTQEEAIESMELLGHTFFVFVNSDTGDMNVVYKREDENYGLLRPRAE